MASFDQDLKRSFEKAEQAGKDAMNDANGRLQRLRGQIEGRVAQMKTDKEESSDSWK